MKFAIIVIMIIKVRVLTHFLQPHFFWVLFICLNIFVFLVTNMLFLDIGAQTFCLIPVMRRTTGHIWAHLLSPSILFAELLQTTKGNQWNLIVFQELTRSAEIQNLLVQSCS